MTDLGRLLAVQELDNTEEALRHRLATLPERRALEAAQAAIAEHERRREQVEAPRRQLERDQRRLEDEVAAVRGKAAEAERDLYGGKVTAVRELQALQEEIDSLRRRASQLEDQVLDLMEQIEPLSDASASLEEEAETLEAEARRASAALAETEAAIDANLDDVRRRRAEEAAAVPPDGLRRYEALRPALAPAVVVRLVGSRCEGCPLQMPAVEVDRIKRLPPGLEDCEECGRLVLH